MRPNGPLPRCFTATPRSICSRREKAPGRGNAFRCPKATCFAMSSNCSQTAFAATPAANYRLITAAGLWPPFTRRWHPPPMAAGPSKLKRSWHKRDPEPIRLTHKPRPSIGPWAHAKPRRRTFMASDSTALAPISIPVSVITGFLGSGKTTLLSRLLVDKRMNNAAVIINEFGEVGLDHQLLTSPREDTILLSSGCLCCSLRGDLVNTLTELWNDRARGQIPAFDRVLVETTGLADPAPVLLTVTADDRLSEVFHVERLITSVDVVH